MRPSLQRWLWEGLEIVRSCKDISAFVSYITINDVKYGHGSLKCEVLNDNSDDYCAAFYSLEMIPAISKAREVATQRRRYF